MKAAQLFIIATMLLTASCRATAQSETIAATQTKPANVSPLNSENRNAESRRRADNAQTPEAVIKEIYALHAADIKAEAEDRIVNSRDRRRLDKYFDKKLADLIWNDLTMERTEDDTYEIGVIDFDLFYAAQEDLPVTNLLIKQTQIADDKATVRANFTSGGTSETVEYTLVAENDAWKISDIKYRNGMSLLKRFSEATR
jgi:hypothetical protein